ncbi:hypothetical protein ACLOJK_039822 [Asimina triloba]
MDLVAAKAEQDEAVNDVMAAILAKQDLEKALSDANMEVISLQGRQLEADSSLHCLAEQGKQAMERASMLSTELVAARYERSHYSQSGYVRSMNALTILRVDM